MATDVGAWRVVLPVLRELDRRGEAYQVMLADPAASIARQDGVAHVALTGDTLDERADAVLAARPATLLLGTSVQAVVERVLLRRIRATKAPVTTLGVLDAMLFVERRFGQSLAELPDRVACPDQATACRLRQAGALASALVVTGNPTLEEIWLTDLTPRPRETDLTPQPPLRRGEGGQASDTASSGIDGTENRDWSGSGVEQVGPEERGRLGGSVEQSDAWKPAPTPGTNVGAGFQHPSPASPNPNLPRLPRQPVPSGDTPNLPRSPHQTTGATDDGHPLFSSEPVDVLFVSSPVAAMRLRGAVFAIDEREALADVLTVLSLLLKLAPGGFHVRVRLHPVQRSEGLPIPPPGILLESDDDPDRLASCAQARVVVGLSSTLLGEARFVSRAAIAYLPGPFWEQERVFAPEYGVRLARSSEELRALLAQALQEPAAPPPLKDHLGAAGRIADVLSALSIRAE